MENDLFVKALHSLRQPQDKKKLLQILIVIRKGIDESSTKSENFRILNESSCIKNLLVCLQMESCSILDITLSILGNGCIDSNFARNSMKLNILHYLDRVLGKHNKDSIVGRTFRIIGNLCDNVCSTIIMAKESQLIDKLVRLLNKAATEKDANLTNHVSEATMLMALRTIRKLLKKSTLDDLIVKHGVLKAISAVLIKYGEDSWEVNSSSANILEEVLRLLHSYSRYAHLQIIPSLKNTESGDSLATLGKLITLNPSRVMKVIINLNKCCLLKSDLPLPDVWQKLLEKIKSNDVSENTYLEYLRSMYKLIDHPSNREYIRLGDSICDLVDILKDFMVCTDFSLECCTIIISMLRICQYDDSLVLKQINAGIVGVLIDKLEWTGVSSMKLSVPNHVKKKRKAKEKCEGEIKKLKLLIDRDTYGNLSDTVLIPYEDRCSSPSELSEISSNGPYSPSCAAIAEDVSDSDNYSPVCSDAEDTDVNSIPSLDPECPTPSDDDDIVCSINVKMKYRFLHEINTLLWRYSRIEPAIAELGSPKLLTTLMNIAFSNEHYISPHKFVMFVMKKADYLIPLMQTNFIQMIFDLTITAHDMSICHSCKHAHETATLMLDALTGVAESGGAKGNIAHVLLRSDVQVKNKIVLAIPYIVRNKHTATKLLINCGGLDVLLNLLEKKSDVQEDSIKGLCILAIHQLKIKNPVHNQPQRQVLDLDVNSYSLSETCTNVVTFKLDDGSSVSADRDFLSDKSDYFNRLLNGCFMESEQSEITLQNISVRSLKILLILLHRNTSSMGVVNVDLDTLLDLLEITERYLLMELNVYLMNCVEQLHMSNKTVPIIYQWSIESGTNILRVETIAFALVGNILDADRIHMFHDLFSLGYYKQLRDDIQKLLVRFLR